VHPTHILAFDVRDRRRRGAAIGQYCPQLLPNERADQRMNATGWPRFRTDDWDLITHS
jgi:hypothetical protein